MKTALITGASSGFGRELAAALLDRGWTVAATLRGAERRRDLFAADAARHGSRLHVLSLDVTDSQERRKAAAYVGSVLGGLDCLVNNAGYGLFGALEDLSEEQLRRQLDVNFLGAVLLTRDLLPHLRARRGRIINVSSVLGFCGFPLTSAYCASKFALEGFSEALHYELRPHGVQVCVVSPGAFRTRFGSNVVWGERSSDSGSVYAAQTANYKRMKQRMSSGPGNPSAPVVRRIARLAEARRMPLRVRVGRDSQLTHFVRRLLPQGLSTGLLGRAFDTMLSKNPPAVEALR